MEDVQKKVSVSEEIQKLFVDDQADRRLMSEEKTGYTQDIEARDALRMRRARGILNEGIITSPNDLHKLAYIFQHGDTVEDIAQALELSKQAVNKGLPHRESLIPQTTDRLMVYQQRDRGVPIHEMKQKYGTQHAYDEDGQRVEIPSDGTATPEELERFGLQEGDKQG